MKCRGFSSGLRRGCSVEVVAMQGILLHALLGLSHRVSPQGMTDLLHHSFYIPFGSICYHDGRMRKIYANIV